MPYYSTDEFINRLKILLGQEGFTEELEIVNTILKNHFDEISVVDISWQTEMTDIEKRLLLSYYMIQEHISYVDRVLHVRGLKQNNQENSFTTFRNYSNRKGELVYYAMAMEQYQDWDQYCRACYDESFEDHVLQATSSDGNKRKSLKRSERHI